MKKTLTLIMILTVLSTILSACDTNNNIEKTSTVVPAQETQTTATSVITEAPTAIATSTPKPDIFEDFDKNYTNIETRNSSVVVANDKVYYTSGSYLYCYDMNENTKMEIETELVASNIHIYEGKVYYLTLEYLKTINTNTNKIESVLELNDVIYNLSEYYTKEDTFVEVTDFFIINNLIKIGYVVDTVDESVIAQIGVWNFIDLRFFSRDGIKIFDDGTYLLENKNEKKEDNRRDVIEYSYYISQNDELIFTISKSYYYIYISEVFVRNAGASSWGSLVTVNDYAYIIGWPESSKIVEGYNLNTFEQIYENKINGALANGKALNQYVLYYYYDRMHVEDYDAGEGVVLIDVKNDKVYENEEINQLISGDIDYMNFMHSDFYLDGDVLYMVENDLNEILWSRELTESDIEGSISVEDWLDTPEKLTDAFEHFYDMVSSVNIYKAEVVDGKLHFTLLYREFEK